jgi:hypothetical protein
MKHRTTAAMMLAVAFAAMVCHFASVGLNLRRRGFTSGEAIGAIGTTMTISVVPTVATIAVLRMWSCRKSKRLRNNGEELVTKLVIQVACPVPSAGSGSVAHR